MNLLKDKIIVITGGNSGIGYAAAKKVIFEGGIPVIVGRDSNKIEKACLDLGKEAIGFTCDVSFVDEIIVLFQNIKQRFDIIHGVVVNAGIAVLENVENVSEKSFDHSINTNLKGAFFTAQKALPLMQQGGAIVFNASLAAHRTFETGAIYAATKAAVVSLASSMALELAKFNIRVNSISPGTVITPIFNKLGMSDKEVQEFLNSYKQQIPLGRAGDPSEIANVIAFLLSNESSFVTGTDIVADGGLVNCVV